MEIFTDKSGRSKGTAMVQFEDPGSAHNSIGILLVCAHVHVGVGVGGWCMCGCECVCVCYITLDPLISIVSWSDVAGSANDSQNGKSENTDT